MGACRLRGRDRVRHPAVVWLSSGSRAQRRISVRAVRHQVSRGTRATRRNVARLSRNVSADHAVSFQSIDVCRARRGAGVDDPGWRTRRARALDGFPRTSTRLARNARSHVDVNGAGSADRSVAVRDVSASHRTAVGTADRSQRADWFVRHDDTRHVHRAYAVRRRCVPGGLRGPDAAAVATLLARTGAVAF